MGEITKRVFALGLLLALGACSPANAVVIEMEPPVETVQTTEPEPPAPAPAPEPEPEALEPVQFCGQADPGLAEVLSDEEALSYLVLVNRCQRVSSTFEPHDLSPVNVESMRLLEGSHHLLRETAARAVEAMFEAAAEAGLRLIASSGYRSYAWQTFFHTDAINRLGLEEARRVSAVPGHSEHQLGLAIDLSTIELEGGLFEVFITTPEGLWVNDNAHKFGFIISYPEGREADTGFIYEPWHIRYVGIDAATAIFEAGQILEEYLWFRGQEN